MHNDAQNLQAVTKNCKVWTHLIEQLQKHMYGSAASWCLAGAVTLLQGGCNLMLLLT